MKVDGGGLLKFDIASLSFYLMTLSKVSLLYCSVSEFSLGMLIGWNDHYGNIVALEVITDCEISLPSSLMGLRNFPRHYFVAGNEFGFL